MEKTLTSEKLEFIKYFSIFVQNFSTYAEPKNIFFLKIFYFLQHMRVTHILMYSCSKRCSKRFSKERYQSFLILSSRQEKKRIFKIFVILLRDVHFCFTRIIICIFSFLFCHHIHSLSPAHLTFSIFISKSVFVALSLPSIFLSFLNVISFISIFFKRKIYAELVTC
jgi:hypothetical protein